MKPIILTVGLLFLWMQPTMAQSGSAQTTHKPGVERKLTELKKIVTLSPAQEQVLEAAYKIHRHRNDSIQTQATGQEQKASLKYQADEQLQQTLMATLTEEQQKQYFTAKYTSAVMSKTEARMQRLRESGQYTEQELAQKQQEIFDYLMAEKIVFLRGKYTVDKRKENTRQLKETQPASLRESNPFKKLEAVKKTVALSPAQEQALKATYDAYRQKNDSIGSHVTGQKQRTVLKEMADKQLHETLMSTLTEEQRIKYLTVIGAPEVKVKTKAKVQLLRESGQYTEQELTQKQQEIFDYLMAEKIIDLRDKYDTAKRKENIRKLKKAQPASLRESNSRQRLEISGKVNNGKVKW